MSADSAFSKAPPDRLRVLGRVLTFLLRLGAGPRIGTHFGEVGQANGTSVLRAKRVELGRPQRPRRAFSRRGRVLRVRVGVVGQEESPLVGEATGSDHDDDGCSNGAPLAGPHFDRSSGGHEYECQRYPEKERRTGDRDAEKELSR